jgi:tetratricopeptide (TPR) repeat protein
MAFEPSIEAARGLAATNSRLGNHADAARILERATSLPGLNADSRIDLHWAASNAWYRTGKLELAEAAAISAVEFRPKDANLHSNLGAIRLKSGRIEDAAKSFRRALDLEPTHYRAHEGLALCLVETGQKRLAHDHFARSLAANISNPRALQALVRIGMELKTYPVAARILTEYIDAQPVNAGLLYSLAGLHYLMGNQEDALDGAARALGLQPGHAGATELIRKIDRSRIDRGQKPRNDRFIGAHGMGTLTAEGNGMPVMSAPLTSS